MISPTTDAYRPFQLAGIQSVGYAMSRHRSCLLADDQGLGKTVQAVGYANAVAASRLLVVCPAHLRINWSREIDKWQVLSPGVVQVTTSKTPIPSDKSVVTSYNLAARLLDAPGRFDLVIIDEMHNLKNPLAKRTQTVLGRGETTGVAHRAPAIVLSGTPFPNGRPDELLPTLRSLAPKLLNGMTNWEFIKKYCEGFFDEAGDWVTTRAKNEEELNDLLYSSGWMVRRLKSDVLPELPPKVESLIVLPAKGTAIKEVLRLEKDYKIADILAKIGTNDDIIAPTLRRKMGEAKAPMVAQFIKDKLESGTRKMLVFGFHTEALHALARRLQEYQPVVVTGKESTKVRQDAVDSFQRNPAIRLFIGNHQAAGTGYTLTAAHDVVLFEPSLVPGENSQCVDRAHRMTQTERVNVYTMVVEGSLDARIIELLARKQRSIDKIMGV